VSVHLENTTHAVNPLHQVFVAAGCHVVRPSVAVPTFRPQREEILQLGSVDGGGQRCAVNQFGAPTEGDATSLTFQRVVVIVT